MANTSTKKPLVVILNWNGFRDTILAIESIKQQSLPVDLVVIDNGSIDNSISELKEKFPHLNLIEEPKNLGFAGGVNVGIEYAIKNGYTYLLLFNNDAIADSQWAEKLVEILNTNPGVGIATGLLLDKTGDKIDSTGEFYSSWGLAFPRERGRASDSRSGDGYVFGATGGASAYRVSMFKDIGLFDEKFFAYYEDTDISFRAQLAGWKVFYTQSSVAYHQQGATSSKIPGFTIYQTFKNLPLLFLKNVPSGLLLKTGIKFYFAYTTFLINSVRKQNGIFALRGFLKQIQLTPYSLRERKKIQRKKTVNVEYINSILWHDLPPEQTGLRHLRKIIFKR